MADEKVLFFDIDGTLVNFDTTILASTITALRLARENGHKLILCTGRSLGQLQGAIKELSFDGGVLAAGAYVRYQDQVIDAITIPGEKLRNIWSFIDEEKLPYIVQCVDHTATERSVKAHLFDVMEHKYEVDENSLVRYSPIWSLWKARTIFPMWKRFFTTIPPIQWRKFVKN